MVVVIFPGKNVVVPLETGTVSLKNLTPEGLSTKLW